MSGSAITLKAEERSHLGKKVQALRRSGMVPAVVYERGKQSENICISYLPMTKAWNKAGKHHTIQLSYGSKDRLTIIKDVTFDPVKGTLSHVAFHAIKQNEAIEAEVPLHLEGQAPATVQGLIVRLNVDHVVLKGLPANIPDSITIDVTQLATPDDDIRAKDIKIPKDVVLNTDEDQVVVSVVVPRAEVEKVEEAEETAAADVPSDHGSAEAPAEKA